MTYRRTMEPRDGTRRLGRRQVVLGAFGGTLAVAVLAACGRSGSSSGSSSGSASASGTTGPATGATSGPADGSPSASAGGSAGGSTGGSTGGGRWERVNLGFVSAYILVRGTEAAVVDTGTSGSADAIGEVLRAAGADWSGVRHLVLTHKHPDHAGSAADVLARATAATGWVGRADLDGVTGPRPFEPLDDGTEVFGLQVVATPGHTAGHVSVLDPGAGVLVVGDALTNTAGLAGSNPQFTADPAAAKASVAKLAGLDVRTVLFGHGEPLTDGAAAAIGRLAAG